MKGKAETALAVRPETSEPVKTYILKANKLEAFEIVKVNRQEIHGADYNPRKITEAARKKLKAGYKRWGNVQPPVVNFRTMNIVGGHQKIKVMDDLIRRNDYDLTVAMVDLDEKEEIALNVFLNNPSAQGEWDIMLLQDIKQQYPDIDYVEDMGFDQSDIDVMLLDTAKEEFDLVTDTVSEAKRETKKAKTSEDYRASKKEARETAKAENDMGMGAVDTIDYVIQIVCRNNQEKREIMRKLRKPEKEKYLKSSILYDIQNGVYDLSVLGGKD
jgi:preprotein translocase subunit Sss1